MGQMMGKRPSGVAVLGVLTLLAARIVRGEG